VKIINSTKAPAALGPYVQAVEINGFVYLSGMLALNPETGEFIDGNIKDHTHQIFKNIVAVLEAAKLTLTNIVKVTVFLNDMEDFVAVNEVYGEYFSVHEPARSCIEVARLPKDASIEIEVIAAK
jgi:endoribonuclease L-PSP, putative